MAREGLSWPAPHDDRLAELVDRLAGEVVLRHAAGLRVLDLGHGAPRITEWVEPRAALQTVVDAIDLGRGPEVRLGARDGAYDLVYSMRTLAHLGHDEDSSVAAARSALREIARLLAPGGVALLQIDNPRSLWGIYHGIRHPKEVLERGPIVIESSRGLTRFDTLGRFKRLLPAELAVAGLHGLRTVVLVPHVLALPIIGRILARIEWICRDLTIVRGFAAHLLVELRRIPGVQPDAAISSAR
jgi:SAM-dependent methyltransferase